MKEVDKGEWGWSKNRIERKIRSTKKGEKNVHEFHLDDDDLEFFIDIRDDLFYAKQFE